jgi:hypothetical protein
MEFLATTMRLFKVYLPTAEVLNELLTISGKRRIVVLGAGSGGGILDVFSSLPEDVEVLLTDLFPYREFQCENPRIQYHPESVDALAVPPQLTGVRVMYTAFHHLRKPVAKQMLNDEVKNGDPVAIFEATERSPKGLLSCLSVPFLIWGITPFMRPIRWHWWLFTYIVPLTEVLVLWDAIVSSLRTYNAADFEELVADLPGYQWRFRAFKGPNGENLSAFTGHPAAFTNR